MIDFAIGFALGFVVGAAGIVALIWLLGAAIDYGRKHK